MWLTILEIASSAMWCLSLNTLSMKTWWARNLYQGYSDCQCECECPCGQATFQPPLKIAYPLLVQQWEPIVLTFLHFFRSNAGVNTGPLTRFSAHIKPLAVCTHISRWTLQKGRQVCGFAQYHMHNVVYYSTPTRLISWSRDNLSMTDSAFSWTAAFLTYILIPLGSAEEFGLLAQQQKTQWCPVQLPQPVKSCSTVLEQAIFWSSGGLLVKHNVKKQKWTPLGHSVN